MKKIILILLAIVPLLCLAQDNSSAEKVKAIIEKQKPADGEFWINCGCNKGKQSPLIVLNGIPLDDGNLDVIDIKDIKHFAVIKDEEAINKYGELGLNGVIEVDVKPNKKYDQLIAEKGIQEQEKEEYEILVFSPGYESFLTTQKSKDFYTESLLKAKNKLMVSEWNFRCRQPSRYNSNIYEVSVDYDIDTDYGLDAEYRIYMFFRFMEKEHNMSLIGDKFTANL
ncbi:MAG: DUF6146 family protein [Prevotella sp.]|jgi:hypothetical protein|nr:DUF6146 family protein [Prevotella sp.]